MGQEITFDCTHGMVSGFMALPPKKKGAGLLILAEYWGVNNHIKDLVERFADDGFVCLAPDLYHGEVAKTPDVAERQMMQLNVATAAKDLQCAVEFLKKQPSVDPKKIGVMGFCMGGQLALFTASLSEDIDACVDFYGIHPNVQPDFASMKCPVLGLFGGLDTYISREMVQKLEDTLAEHTISHTFVTYEHVGHAFYNDTRKEVYNKEAAEDAHKKVLQFLREHLS